MMTCMRQIFVVPDPKGLPGNSGAFNLSLQSPAKCCGAKSMVKSLLKGVDKHEDQVNWSI